MVYHKPTVTVKCLQILTLKGNAAMEYMHERLRNLEKSSRYLPRPNHPEDLAQNLLVLHQSDLVQGTIRAWRHYLQHDEAFCGNYIYNQLVSSVQDTLGDEVLSPSSIFFPFPCQLSSHGGPDTPAKLCMCVYAKYSKDCLDKRVGYGIVKSAIKRVRTLTFDLQLGALGQNVQLSCLEDLRRYCTPRCNPPDTENIIF